MLVALHLRMQDRQRPITFAVANSLEKVFAPDFGNENRNPGLFYLNGPVCSIQGGDAMS